jgi:hypothetical protein
MPVQQEVDGRPSSAVSDGSLHGADPEASASDTGSDAGDDALRHWDERLARMTNPDAVAALMAREEYADAAYDHIRSLDPETDIARLAEIEARGDLRDERRRGGDNSVACVRRPTPARRGVARFDADPDMADAWRRLQRGEARRDLRISACSGTNCSRLDTRRPTGRHIARRTRRRLMPDTLGILRSGWSRRWQSTP